MRPKSFGNTSKNNSPPRQLPPRTRRKKGPTGRGATTVIDEEDGATRVTVENDALVPVPVKHLKKPHELSMENFAASLARKKIEGLKAEFKELQALQPPEASYTEFIAGKGKNRYDNIVCFDRTRVVLTYQVPPESSYIHANWVGSSIVKLTNKYICTQGPMDNTINDFWRMIWQEKVRHIAMLCGTVENGKPKCAQYYPMGLEETKVYGTISVTNKKNITAPHEKIYESSLFEVVAEKQQDPPILVTFMRWLDWPDFGIPQSGMGMLRIMKTISSTKDTTAVLHCSAGAGRTGTLMACELCLKVMLSGKELNVPEVVKELRTQRAGSIQTESQYIYLHRALSEYIYAKKLAKEDVAKFFIAFTDHRRSLAASDAPK